MSIVAILIVYNCRIQESKTLNSLLQNYTAHPEAFKDFKLIIYDNSLSKQTNTIQIPFEHDYIHDPSNRGLAVAYNYALRHALEESRDWLLLLDQDSCLPGDFICKLRDDLSVVEGEKAVAAIVPKMRYNEIIFSPARVSYGGIVRAVDMIHKGLCTYKNAYAIGSCCIVRVSFLKKVGGFNEQFPIDCLDRWLFLVINESGSKVYVTDSIIDHELSVMNYDMFMSESRYRSILKSETLFMKIYKSRIENYIFYLRLIKRAAHQFFTVNNKKYSLMTLRHLSKLVLSLNNMQDS
jgi:GT2 family glycosyltransferase